MKNPRNLVKLLKEQQFQENSKLQESDKKANFDENMTHMNKKQQYSRKFKIKKIGNETNFDEIFKNNKFQEISKLKKK